MIEDISGNKLYRLKNTIYLHLANEPHARIIGVINEGEKTLQVTRKSEIHLFRKGNAYGFNEQILKTASKFDKVLLIVDGNQKFLIPVSIILKEGSYMNFKSQGFELQLFLKVPTIETYKI